MKIKVGKIIGIVIFTLVVFGISYVGTYYIDKLNREGLKTDIKVVYEDTNDYTIPNTSLLTKEKALEEWPYKFTITNEGKITGIYQLIIKDDENNDIKRDKLSYALYNEDSEIIKTGKLNELKNSILLEKKINKNEEHQYQLYIYKDSEDEGTVYKYKIELVAILDGGPGF